MVQEFQLSSDSILDQAKHVLHIEAAAVNELSARMDNAFVDAVRIILACQGRVIVTGIGKSGHIARKIAATFASTGTPAYFVHAAEAAHGDLGMITTHDVVVALSYSGASEELLVIVPVLKRRGATLIAMTGHADSPLARLSDIHLDCAVREEACPLNLAPTASTTATLALGDALAVTLLQARGFGSEDFALSHPGGALGRRLLTHVRDVMRPVDKVPCVYVDVTAVEALLKMTQGGLGMVVVVAHDSFRVAGIFTDGDLRRTLEKGIDLRKVQIGEIMTRQPLSIGPDALAAEAAALMERQAVSQLLVIDENDCLLGALNMHDLMRAKVI